MPELVPIRYGRMLVSPFTFYRGAAKIMAHDLAGTPRSGLTVQACGDAHLSNFGVFASPERQLVFDINDFDETLPGPWEWDVKRLAASMIIAARDNGFAAKDQDKIVLDTVGEYRTAMRTFAGMNNLEVWYAHLEIQSPPGAIRGADQTRSDEKDRSDTGQGADARQHVSVLEADGAASTATAQIVDQSPLIVPLRVLLPGDEQDAVFAWLHSLIRVYRQSLEHDRRKLLEQLRAEPTSRARSSASEASGRGRGSR